VQAQHVKLHELYEAKVSGRPVVVRTVSKESRGGWWAINLKTGRTVRIKTARRLSPLSQREADRLRANNPLPPLAGQEG
jgi:hypothetical protein